MPTITRELPAFTVLSGPAKNREKLAEALAGAGLKVTEDYLVDGQKVADDHGLPSHPNPQAAKKAGVPNAGHTPGTEHPDTGEPYVEDSRVSFLTMEGEAMDKAAQIAEPFKWVYRLHSAPRTIRVEELSTEERLAIIEHQLARIRGEE